MNTFEITIRRKSDDFWPVNVRINGSDGLPIDLPEMTMTLEPDDLDQLRQPQLEDEVYGEILGQALFHASPKSKSRNSLTPLRESFASAFEKSNQSCPLRILLSIDNADDDCLKTLDWQKLSAPINTNDWSTLSGQQNVLFSMYIPTANITSFPLIRSTDLRALLLVANLSNSEKGEKFDVVKDVLCKMRTSLDDDIPYKFLANININDIDDINDKNYYEERYINVPTLDNLYTELASANKKGQPYTFLHIISEGRLSQKNKDTLLFWDDKNDTDNFVEGEELVKKLKGLKPLPHFAFLCICNSAAPASEIVEKSQGLLGGLAQRLARQLGLPAVIGMTREVSHKTGLDLGNEFYCQLKKSGEVDKALKEAIDKLGNRADIAVPVLFNRLGARPLFISDERFSKEELTNEQIEQGIKRFKDLLKERAPHASVLKENFEKQKNLLTDSENRSQALKELNNICYQVFDLTFDELASGKKEPPAYEVKKCPFPGLSSFGKKEFQEFFFGRGTLIDELKKALENDKTLKNDKNFLAVLGPSGTGKSSLVLAGLIPALQKDNPGLNEKCITPGSDPVNKLKAKINQLSEQTAVLVVDQFEELFTLCSCEDTRKDFIELLLDFAQKQKVVITMRADFLGECAYYSDLKTQINNNFILVGPMEPKELAEAIQQQAQKAKLRFEHGLNNSILAEVEKEPGAMPLLQYALQQLYDRRRGKWLCYEEYREIGGIRKAIATTADKFYKNLKLEEQEQVKNIFLRLTHLDANLEQKEEPKDTRQRVALKDLVPADGTPEMEKIIEDLVDRLAGEEARLVVKRNDISVDDKEVRADKGTVEVAHEALIRHWETLKTWLREKRANLQLRQTISQEAKAWEDEDKDEGYLNLQGILLENAEKLSKQNGFLNTLEADYVAACMKRRDREEQEKLEASLDVSISYSQLLFASNKRLDALLNLIKTGRNLQKTGRNLQEELEKYEYYRLRFLVILGQVFSELAEYNSIDAYEYDEVTSVAWNPNNQIVASASSRGIIKIWSADGTPIDELNSDQGAISDLTFSSDGKFLASASSDLNYRTIQLWEKSISNKDTKNKKEVTFLKTHRLEGHRDEVNSISFRPGDVNSNLEDEIILASASQDGTIKLWNQKGTLVRTLKDHKYPVKCVAFSPDGKMIASGDSSGVVIIRSRDGKLIQRIDKESAGEEMHTQSVTSINFSPDGKTLVSSGLDKLIKFWDINGEFVGQLDEQKREVLYVTFSPDGRLMASTEIDGNIKLWFENEKSWSQGSKLLRTFKHEKRVPKVSFSKDGKRLISCSDDKTIRFWNCCSKFDGYYNGKAKGHTDWITSIKFNVDNKTITTATKDKTVNVWNYDGKLLPSDSDHNDETYSEVKSSQNDKIVAISHDGKMTATVEPNEKHYEIKLENHLDGQLKKGISRAKLSILDLKFSQCDKTIILISKDYIELWQSDDLSKAKSIQLNIEKDNGDISAASLSSDGSKLAVAYSENDGYEQINRIRLWNLDLKEALEEAERYVQSYRDSKTPN